MSETDSFIEEVTEEVRRDKLFAMFRKYGWIGVALVALIVGGAGWTEWTKARDRAQAQAFGDAVLAALDSDDAAARAAALDQIGAEGEAARNAVLGFLAADEALKADDRAGALARLQSLAADEGLPSSYRQLAEIKAVVLGGETMDPAARDTLLAELAQPGAPFRVLAMEQQALVLVAAGKDADALTLLRQILDEPDATAGLRRRVTQLIVVLGGEPEAA